MLLVGFFSINTNSFFIVGGVVGLVAFLMAAILWRGAKLKLFTYERLKFSDILLAIAAFLLIACLDQWLFSLLGTDATENNHAIDGDIQMRSTLWLVLLGTFIGPFIEEVVYHGMGLKYMFRGFPWVEVIILSALFTYTHGPSNFIEFLIYFQSAVIYSLVYLKTKRIVLPLLMHIVNNAFTFIPLLF
ncbi:CPBP family intramembrane metalloprotease [Staphylococcus chromogenes]|uniref:CPBP family intramembrane glutamic endopeptidase n=1 Tax=Staphylococcus chromogenes TaxID=46126 RepID=UPI001187FDA4|nr:type II CAAX endopeptidase family protein [Staphylococcus chromogenes]QDW92564.1 CPBP family intramembrane metalloprotease [Staphylococcus chromogenes]QIN27607.1 CPBP family intramembrane metalloprotease [Staphylococcus chromogenes]